MMGTDRFDTLFLDRDGVINRLRPKDYVKTWEEFEFISGSVEALRILASRFRYILVVTNQRGVGRGVMTEQDLQTIHDKMLQEIRQGGGRIDRIYVCTAVGHRIGAKCVWIGCGQDRTESSFESLYAFAKSLSVDR